MTVTCASGNKGWLAVYVPHRKDVIWLLPIPGANCTTGHGAFSAALLLLYAFIGNRFRLMGLHLEVPLIVPTLRFVIWSVRGKWQACQGDNPLLCSGMFMVKRVAVL